MKKIYRKPEVMTLKIVQSYNLLEGSPLPTGRNADVPTDFPSDIPDASEGDGMSSGRGQGNNGSGNSAKGSMWDEFDEEW